MGKRAHSKWVINTQLPLLVSAAELSSRNSIELFENAQNQIEELREVTCPPILVPVSELVEI